MTHDIEDMLGIDLTSRPKPIRPAKTTPKHVEPTAQLPVRKGPYHSNRGPLHDVFTRSFPDLVNPRSGLCDIKKLAKSLGMTYQGVYKWMSPRNKNKLPARQIKRLVELSQKQVTGGEDFVPATNEDFLPFVIT